MSTRMFRPALAAVVTVAATAVPAATATARAHGQSFVLYGKQKRAQFVNHADDRDRGNKTNPFGDYVLPTPPSANSGKKGMRAGDNALITLTLYVDRKLTRPAGTAILSCTFNFAQEAMCEADYELRRGTVLALGPAKLDGRQIVLAVTGGTGRHVGAHGQVTSNSSPTNKNTQILHFTLL
jgi:hypothetical protein